MGKLSRAQLADVFDALANYVDGIEYKKEAEATAARTERVSKIAERYEISTGEALPEEIRNKLAACDADALDYVLKVSNHSDESPDPMGRSSEIHADTDPAPRTTKEAAEQSEKRFLDWIVSE